MRSRTKAAIALATVVLGAGVAYYCFYVLPVTRAESECAEGIRLCESGDNAESARLLVGVLEQPGWVASETTRIRAIKALGTVCEEPFPAPGSCEPQKTVGTRSCPIHWPSSSMGMTVEQIRGLQPRRPRQPSLAHDRGVPAW